MRDWEGLVGRSIFHRFRLHIMDSRETAVKIPFHSNKKVKIKHQLVAGLPAQGFLFSTHEAKN